MKRFTLKRPAGFSLDAHAQFYATFTPGSGMAAAAAGTGQLIFTFRLDGTFEATAAVLREEGDALTLEVEGPKEPEVALRQVERILGLECDGEAWLALGRKDRVVGALQRQFPGFYTATFPSPYDAAAWDMFSHRTPQQRAVTLKTAFAHEHGDVVKLAGVHHVFPGPQKVLQVASFPGLSDEKLARMHAVARAALEGRLDADRLRAMPEAAALADLEEIRGVGEWTSNHVLKRGAGPPDAPPTTTPAVCALVGELAGLDHTPSGDEVLALAEGWRPFRMWVTVMLARALVDRGGWKMTAAQLKQAKPQRRGHRARGPVSA